MDGPGCAERAEDKCCTSDGVDYDADQEKNDVDGQVAGRSEQKVENKDHSKTMRQGRTRRY